MRHGQEDLDGGCLARDRWAEHAFRVITAQNRKILRAPDKNFEY
jgi:hypothetical protein